MKKQIGYGVLYLALAASVMPVLAEERPQPEAVIQESQSDSVFKGAMYRVWSRLRALKPRVDVDESARGRLVVTAGIRGAESTDTVLKPYWKEDRTADEGYLQELKSYEALQALIEAGQWPQAIAGLDKFIRDYPDSDLASNAYFARALAVAGSGELANGIEQFREFIKAYPGHPLKGEAEIAIAELATQP